MNKFLGAVLVISFSSPVITHAKAAKAASIQSISQMYAGSNLEKRALLRECQESKIEELQEICSKRLVDLSSADVDRIKEGLASRSESSEQAASAAVVEEEMVSVNKASVNVASGNGVQQSTTSTVNRQSYMDCVMRATTNVNRVVSSLNARMAGRFANK